MSYNFKKGELSASPPRTLHTFGYAYSPDLRKQTYFSHQQPKTMINLEEVLHQIQQENHQLKRQLNEVHHILVTILCADHHQIQQIQEKSLMDLLEELLALILSKAEENASLKQKIEEMSIKTIQNIESRISLSESKQMQSFPQSQLHLNQPFDENYLMKYSQQQSATMQSSDKTARYKPKILFSIGKEVKSVNQLSSNTILKNHSSNSYSKASSQENSYKELMKLTKKSRLSIDKSIYIVDEKQLDGIRFSVQSLNQSNSNENFQKKSIRRISNELTPIKEQRFSDKYSELNYSKIRQGSSHPLGERFTFESTSTDPESYSNNKSY